MGPQSLLETDDAGEDVAAPDRRTDRSVGCVRWTDTVVEGGLAEVRATSVAVGTGDGRGTALGTRAQDSSVDGASTPLGTHAAEGRNANQGQQTMR